MVISYWKKYKIVWTKIEDLKNIELNALSVNDDRYIKTYKDKDKRTYGDFKIYTKIIVIWRFILNTDFRGLNVPAHGVECKSFTAICIDLLLVF